MDGFVMSEPTRGEIAIGERIRSCENAKSRVVNEIIDELKAMLVQIEGGDGHLDPSLVAGFIAHFGALRFMEGGIQALDNTLHLMVIERLKDGEATDSGQEKT
jgi:hypothetical protein